MTRKNEEFGEPISPSLPLPVILRSRRRSAAIQVKDGRILLRVPRSYSHRQIRELVASHRRWLQNAWEREVRRREEAGPPLSAEEQKALILRAKQVIPARVAYYAPLVGVTYGRIILRCQKTRWGSCSAKGNLNFNWLLLLAPEPVLDSVVVHELCHRKEMNHSRRFYAEVYRVFPEYARWDRWLKEHGGALLYRLPAGNGE